MASKDVRLAVAAALKGARFPAIYKAEVLKDTPRGYWRCDETTINTGVIADSSGNGCAGSVRNPNSTMTSVSGALTDGNKAFSKADTNVADGLTINDNAQLDFGGQALTLEGWVRTTAPGSFSYLISKLDAGGSGSKGYLLRVANANLQLYIGNGPGAQVGFDPTAFGLFDGAWHHVVATWDGLNARFYIDHVLRSTLALATTMVASDGGNGFFLSDNRFGGTGFAGSADELAVYASVLPQDRIDAHYYAGLGLSTQLAFTSVWPEPPPMIQNAEMPAVVVQLWPTDSERRLSAPAGGGAKLITRSVQLDVLFWLEPADAPLGERVMDDMLDAIDLALRSSTGAQPGPPNTLGGAVALAYETVSTERHEPTSVPSGGDTAGLILFTATRRFSALDFAIG